LHHLSENPDLCAADVGRALVGRTSFPHRAVVVGTGIDELTGTLTALAGGDAAPGLVTGRAGAARTAAFVFPGQGSQWAGMALELMTASPVFAASMADCAVALSEFVDWSLPEVLADADALAHVDVVQPALWAVMVSLAAVWREFGVHPGAVVGHSQGEIAAACVAGALSLADGARVVALRSRLIREHLSQHGGMLSVVAPEDDVRALLTDLGDRVAVAAVNGPKLVTVSGDQDSLVALEKRLSKAGIMRWRLEGVNFAAHSPQVAKLEDELLAQLGPITPRSAPVPFYSSVTGGLLDTAEMDAGYWFRNLRQTVLFSAAVGAMTADGTAAFVEASPHPVLKMAIEQVMDSTGDSLVFQDTLRTDEGGWDRMLAAVAGAHAHGIGVDWRKFFEAAGARRVPLPTYAFQRRNYWPEPQPAEEPVTVESAADARLWAAVDGSDVGALASLLDVDNASLGAVLPALSSWRRKLQHEAAVDRWWYRTGWTAVTAPAGAAPAGSWLAVVAAGTERERWVVQALAALGEDVTVLRVDEADPAALATALAELPGTFTAVVSLLAAAETPLPEAAAVPAGLALTLVLAQAFGIAGIEAPLWCVTRGAVAIGDSREAVHPTQSLIWGFGRTAALELPKNWGGLVDLPETLTSADAWQLAWVLSGIEGEDQVALRAGRIHGRRLTRYAPTELSAGTGTVTGTVLITGGTGALGADTARWLARAGAQRLVLTSRRGPDAPGASELVRELAELGAEATVTACDVADRDQLAAVLAAISGEHPLTGVVHTAGVGQVGRGVDVMTVAEVQDVLAAKVAGAHHLDRLLDGYDLDFFVLFSSTAGSLGSGRQAAYSAANAYLDALAEDRVRRGLAGTSIGWGIWADAGMGTEGDMLEHMRRHGLVPLVPAEAMTAFGRVFRHGGAVLAADFDWNRFAQTFSSARPSALLRDLPEAQAALDETTQAGGDADEAASALRTRLAAFGDAERAVALLDLVRSTAAGLLGHTDPADIDPAQAFRDMGVDSLTAVEIRNALRERTGLRLPSTLVFDYPTAQAIASHLRTELFGDTADVALTGEEAKVKRFLTTVSFDQLRSAGLMDLLAEAADRAQRPPTEEDADESRDGDIGEMDADELVRFVLGGQD
jgi:acyl transferase domain-containing protein